MKVLFVQEEPMLTTALKITLLKQGYEVIFCKNASQAINAIKSSKPHLLIADVMLSGQRSELMLSAKKKHIPVILLSDLGAEGQLQQAFDLDADDYATLPLSLPELSLRVNKLTRLNSFA